jgi:hypothetical protein
MCVVPSTRAGLVSSLFLFVFVGGGGTLPLFPLETYRNCLHNTSRKWLCVGHVPLSLYVNVIEIRRLDVAFLFEVRKNNCYWYVLNGAQ